MADEKKAGFWAIVEIFGHVRLAGFVSEFTFGGQSFVRVDVPEIAAEESRHGDSASGPISAHTKMYGPGAIYAIHPVDEAIAKATAASIREVPVQSYGMRDLVRNMSQNDRDNLLLGPAQDERG